ncbi:hypothetical protein CCR75_000077 [Bremia lactucae]|uniref:Uncharacterized protein n=1 Tax=Bremia lactucae TaxID=4779 RepID=A0A976ICG3_BRELC|nr:hypothetical protein CCR75_000077 [Bremia lactucae]
MDWSTATRRITECSKSLLCGNGGLGDELRVLQEYLEHEDVMVAYAAKEELLKVLASGKIANIYGFVHSLLLPPPFAWVRESSGFRFQLLRQLIQMKKEVNPNEDRSQSGSSSDTWNQSKHYANVQIMLKHLNQIKTMVRSVFISTGCILISVPHSVQFEALVFVREFVKCLRGMKTIIYHQVELSGMISGLVEDVFVMMDYGFQSTYVSCAVLRLLSDFLEVLKYWNDRKDDNNWTSVRPVYLMSLKQCTIWVLQSSCSTTALHLLTDKKRNRSHENFIANMSFYSFTQHWLLFSSRVGVAVVEASKPQTNDFSLELLPLTGACKKLYAQLPSRHQLFVVLAEQDSVLVKVLNNVTRIADGVDDFRFLLLPEFTELLAEYDPDLLFADLIDTIRHDHLILLDLLISNETEMLEYLMQHLRRFCKRWTTSKQKLQSYSRLEDVMGVLIRLRLEIDRLVAADLFPYGAKPLTRRLMSIEKLYEEEPNKINKN